jgi:predicted RNase H-like nuclease
MKCPRRVEYKVSKARRYWPSFTVPQRVDALLKEYAAICGAIESAFGPLKIPLPAGGAVQTLASVKRYEDVLDALVCAWVGVEFLAGRTIALGDHTAAIWCPRDVVLSYPGNGD